MTEDTLSPKLDLLRQEYVLVQAWKKTASYIRYHNWFSDTLELDRAAVNLPRFLSTLMERLEAPDQWTNDPLRIVPAPKSQRWMVTIGNNGQAWAPAERGKNKAPLRPLAHVSLKDQVAATAVMLCIANRVETLQGDPRAQITDAETRKHLISYGNRLFCDEFNGDLRHRWGSAKLYRAFSQDYHSFLTRPAVVANEATPIDGTRVVIVHSDLRQFYDRVRPELLIQKLSGLRAHDEEATFFKFAVHLLNWKWHSKDTTEVGRYAKDQGIEDFSSVALPQGLVASGFFANVVLLDFDQSLREVLSQEQNIEPGVRILDACRYVDDLRIVLRVNGTMSLTEIEEFVFSRVLQLLESHAPGLEPKREKTVAAVVGGEERPLVRQSRKMQRIQGAISGGFDAVRGEEIIDAVQGLIRSQQRFSEQRAKGERWSLSPLPDVRDNTVARFAAARFRRTYRSLRPLLADQEKTARCDEAAEEDSGTARHGAARTRPELDDEARAFALGLIERWVEDPSNVRLLRIGLDIWPSSDVLKGVLGLLRPFTEKGGRRGAPRRVVWYCLSEILRAGATETGFVEEVESLPTGIDIGAYRSVLRDEAIRLLELPSHTVPWYLRQQALLFLAANEPTKAPIVRTGRNAETKLYRELIRFLRNEGERMTGADFATLAVLSRRSFATQETAVDLVLQGITRRRLEQVAERDPSFALEILNTKPDLVADVSPRRRDDLGLGAEGQSDGWVSLAKEVLGGRPDGLLRNELAILRFALKFLDSVPKTEEPEAITPADILLKLGDPEKGFSEESEVRIVPSRVSPRDSLYCPPLWCPPEGRWRFQLGYLLRFILAARPDFTKTVRPPHWKECGPAYRPAESHWYQRLYGLFSGHSAFGDDWLPVTDWTEKLLYSLLKWPGCRTSEMDLKINDDVIFTQGIIRKRLQELCARRGTSSGLLMLPLITPRPDASSLMRPLRACVVQTVIPTDDDFTEAARSEDLSLSGMCFRRWHRNHLSAALAAVERMLDLRNTHQGSEGGLDWLILPELAVHPRDVRTHLVPFARAHKTIVLAGLTYERLLPRQPLINSALWVIPIWTKAHGLQIVTRRQCKQHLSPEETKLNTVSQVVQGFRPCQWLIGYDWSNSSQDQPLWLTAAVCYDATDLSLAADLRHQSDIFAIPALNKDVATFDHMARALHYHMFQRVVVANNGKYGGSNAYYPCGEVYERQIFHLHGQPQASIAFLEIDKIADFVKRKELAADPKSPWKSLPAGMDDEVSGGSS